MTIALYLTTSKAKQKKLPANLYEVFKCRCYTFFISYSIFNFSLKVAKPILLDLKGFIWFLKVENCDFWKNNIASFLSLLFLKNDGICLLEYQALRPSCFTGSQSDRLFSNCLGLSQISVSALIVTRLLITKRVFYDIHNTGAKFINSIQDRLLLI